LLQTILQIFGFPTGIGALLARRSALDMLTENRYFAGGTIKGATGLGSNISRHLFHKHHARFEYGTLPFMEIIALEAGFDVLDSELGGIDSVSSHTAELAEEMIDRMLALKHKNGQNLCKIYRGSGYASFDDKYPARHGPIINFNLFTADGNPLKPSSVQRLASLKNIHLRNQSFCNPGASQLHLEIDDEHMSKYLDERDSEEIACGMHDFSLSDGRLISSLRISFGPTSTLADIENFHNFLREFFLCDPLILKFPRNSKTPLISVQEICIYPIKSCGKFSVSSWKLEDRGLVYDREWMIIDRATKRPLSQKRFSRMCLIKPEICLQNRIMHIKAEGLIFVSFNYSSTVK
jgi:molybdenum cofactor sulfurtransferase